MVRNVAFISVVPSPYQRALFHALAHRPELKIRVFYLEASAPDSPWPEKPLAPYEEILKGSWFALGSARFHYNHPLPDLGGFDAVVLNIPVNSITGQWLMRWGLRADQPWLFWGERLRERSGWSKLLHDLLIKPLHRATAIVGVGTRAMEDYRNRFPGPAHYSVPYHCELRPFLDAPRPPRNGSDVVFFFCGQMIARKGVDLLIAAFEQIAAQSKNAKLLLVGREAELPSLLSNVKPAIRERISYAGFQAPDELPRFFARADVFVLPSRYEGWGVVVNQALGAGLPIICSDAVGAGYDLVVDDKNGLKFKTDDVNDLTEKMQRFVTEPPLSAKLGAVSKQMAQEWLPEKGAEKWIKIFQETGVR